MSRDPFYRRARIKARTPEEFKRWRRLVHERQKRRHEGKVKDDMSSFRNEDRSVA
jgi:hypothetical protein